MPARYRCADTWESICLRRTRSWSGSRGLQLVRLLALEWLHSRIFSSPSSCDSSHGEHLPVDSGPTQED
ncbi:hypothetical protein LEMLEM_LOCUS22429 [Lemmus lemmus]